MMLNFFDQRNLSETVFILVIKGFPKRDINSDFLVSYLCKVDIILTNDLTSLIIYSLSRPC